MSATHQLCCLKLNSNETDLSNILLICFAYICTYICFFLAKKDVYYILLPFKSVLAVELGETSQPRLEPQHDQGYYHERPLLAAKHQEIKEMKT